MTASAGRRCRSAPPGPWPVVRLARSIGQSYGGRSERPVPARPAPAAAGTGWPREPPQPRAAAAPRAGLRPSCRSPARTGPAEPGCAEPAPGGGGGGGGQLLLAVWLIRPGPCRQWSHSLQRWPGDMDYGATVAGSLWRICRDHITVLEDVLPRMASVGKLFIVSCIPNISPLGNWIIVAGKQTIPRVPPFRICHTDN